MNHIRFIPFSLLICGCFLLTNCTPEKQPPRPKPDEPEQPITPQEPEEPDEPEKPIEPEPTPTNSPYIARVLEYRPAPGQFVGKLPLYQEGDTAETMRQKAEQSIAGSQNTLITLGGFGGYVTFAFDHMVPNKEGADLLILGNALYSTTIEGRKGGSCEPGIVMVAYDKNGNRQPDEDEWYELAGSEQSNFALKRNVEITYFYPPADHTPKPGSPAAIVDTEYIRWEDNQGREGYIEKLSIHKQSYYPEWLGHNPLSYHGTQLPPNAIAPDKPGGIWYLMAYDWGYVDNHPNKYEQLNSFDIANAIDKNGQKVTLPGAHFFKVYTAVCQQCGVLGETSTEIRQARDLHEKNSR